MGAYENQLLGAFIYMLGYTGARVGSSCMALNLFQQTPRDKEFGDLVVGATSCVAFEFKRDAGSIWSEIEKWNPDGRDAFLSSRELCAFSETCHYLVFGTGDLDAPDLRQCEYVRALRAVDVPDETERIEPLLERIHSGRDFGRPGEEVQQYLEGVSVLKRWGPGGPGGGGGGGGDGPPTPPRPDTAWLAICRNPNGQLCIRAAASLGELLTGVAEAAEAQENDRFFTA